MELIIGQTYEIPCLLPEDNENNRSPKKYIPAVLIKEYECFYLFQTKHYKTTMHKTDREFIKEVSIDKRTNKKVVV